MSAGNLTTKKRRKQLYFTPKDIANGIMAEQVFQSSQWVSARDHDAALSRIAALERALEYAADVFNSEGYTDAEGECRAALKGAK